MTSTTETGRTRAGLDQLLRRWRPEGQAEVALLLVHGINEHSGRYEHVGDALAARGVDVLAFDLRGHGGTGGRPGHIDAFADFLDDVEDLLAERRRLARAAGSGVAHLPVVLLGHSLGGLIGTAYAESDRPQPDLLALSAPALTATVPPALRLAIAVLGRLAPRLAVANDFDPDLLTRDPAVGRAYAEDAMRVRRSTARQGLEILRAMKASRAGLDRIRVPTWVVHGAGDELVPPAASAGFEGRPDTVRVVLPGLRHESFNEPEGPEVIGRLVDWIFERRSSRDPEDGASFGTVA
jgi:alpha-beta hydrolase superfamily lysophospholipase